MAKYESSLGNLIQILTEVGRDLGSRQAMSVRKTLLKKGKRKNVIAHASSTGLRLRPKSGKDVLKTKIRDMKRRHNPLYIKKKQKRAFKLTDRGIRA